MKAILTTEKAAARAQTLLTERFDLPADGPGASLVPLHALPDYIKTGSVLNRNWNFAVLNILEQTRDIDVDRAVLRTVRVQPGAKPDRLPSDDTQLAFWTLEQMLEDGRFVPACVAERFSRGRIYGIGSTVKQFLRNYKGGQPWEQCGVASAGNGALMRIAPVLIPHLKTPTAELWADAALGGMLTHNDAGSTAACVAIVLMLWELLAMTSPPAAEWWLEAYVRTARELEGDTRYEPRSADVAHYEGPIWRFVQERVGAAFRKSLSVLDAGNSWYSGAYLLETVPSAMYILMRHGHDPEEAIVRAVHDTKDNDTVAAIVGAAVGALHGRAGLPTSIPHPSALGYRFADGGARLIVT